MKYKLIILLSVLNLLACGQSKKEIDVLANSRLLEGTVFGTKDSVTLEKLFGPTLAYAHSSGLVQTRAEAIHGAITNKSVYTVSSHPEGYNVRFDGDSAKVTHIFRAMEKKVDGTESPLNLSIELVWLKEKGKWKLARRQATKVPAL